MADVRPFQGIRYNQSVNNDISTVICPPHDVISPQLQQELYGKSEYNFVRVELPQDFAEDNKYARSANTLNDWLKYGILKADEVPAIYLYDHHFTYQGGEYKRRCIMARVRLEEWDTMVIRPHEDIVPTSRSDRLSLLWACQANTSPILAMFEDEEQRVASLLAGQAQNKPVISANGDEESHYVWAITEPEVIKEISTNLAQQPLYIADGHNRYESALIYRREQFACSPSASTDDAFNFVMMALVAFSDPGLMVLPTHRLVRGVPEPVMVGFVTRLEAFFDIEELPLSTPDVWQRLDELLGTKAPGTDQTRLAVFGLAAESIVILKLRDAGAVKTMMPYFHSELYRNLDVSIIDHVIMEKLLGLSHHKEKGRLDFTSDREDAVKKVKNKRYQLAFLVSPVEPTMIKTIADAGERMPRKSTYFYPKAPAGLVINRLVETPAL